MTRNLVWEPAIARSASWPLSVEGRIIAALPEEALATRGSTGRIRHQQLLSAIRKAAKIPESLLRPGFLGRVDCKRMPGLCRMPHAPW